MSPECDSAHMRLTVMLRCSFHSDADMASIDQEMDGHDQ